jgi:hypothetical protein
MEQVIRRKPGRPKGTFRVSKEETAMVHVRLAKALINAKAKLDVSWRQVIRYGLRSALQIVKGAKNG